MEQTLELYHKDLLRHAARACGHGRLNDPDATVQLNNPLCGDRVTVDLCLEDGAVSQIGHEVKACALCQASMSILSSHAAGNDRDAIARIMKETQSMLSDRPVEFPADWQDLAVFAPVIAHRSRHRCVLMPFEAVLEACDAAAG